MRIFTAEAGKEAGGRRERHQQDFTGHPMTEFNQLARKGLPYIIFTLRLPAVRFKMLLGEIALPDFARAAA